MANRARLAAPPPEAPQVWPWHQANCRGVSASLLMSGERRLEAQTYLSSGFGIRLAIESQTGWKHLGEMANVWMPGRLKGIQVTREFGTPFLAATQVYDARPIVRKWLSLDRTSDSENRFVGQGSVLVTCSGSVGRPTMTYAVHDKTLISHDLLRVQSSDPAMLGWLYAFLHSSHAREMAIGAHYGHIIKHLEPAHLQALPVPPVSKRTAEQFGEMFSRILSLRNSAYRLTREAEDCFAKALGALDVRNWGESGFTVKASRAFVGARLRLDAAVHNPGASAIQKHLKKRGEGFTAIADAGYELWLPKRFRRVPAADGVWLLDSADLTEINPVLSKRIADGDFGDAYQGRVKAGWVLMARSGQTYGIIGTPVLATSDLEDKIISDHVMRIKPSESPDIAPGYLVTALGHPTLGRPLVKALAYGSSIPEIEVSDMAMHEVVRLRPDYEAEIATFAAESASDRAMADAIERDMAAEASEIIQNYIDGKPRKRASKEPQQIARHILDIVAPDAE